MLVEMQEFSSFAPAEQRYICRALEVAAGSHSALRRWARDIDEARSIRNQARTYRWRDHVVRLLAEERYLEMADRKSVVSGTSGSVGLELGGRRIHKKKTIK